VSKRPLASRVNKPVLTHVRDESGYGLGRILQAEPSQFSMVDSFRSG